jgi:mono/diheme cytochrome c family protein
VHRFSDRGTGWVAAGLVVLVVSIPAPELDAQGRGGRGGNAADVAPAAPLPLGPVTGSVSNGRELYFEHTCYGCHGFNGETGARDLVGTNSPILANEENFTRFMRLRADEAPLFPSTRMPNYPESALGNDEARDIYAFIRSFRLDAPEVEDVPALRAIVEAASRPYEP